jgi:hypothetical protein
LVVVMGFNDEDTIAITGATIAVVVVGAFCAC